MTSRCASVVAILVASFPAVVNAQVDCGAIIAPGDRVAEGHEPCDLRQNSNAS
jgi:hypothetical protein